MGAPLEQNYPDDLGSKICCSCREDKDWSRFSKDRNQPDKRSRRCKDCDRKYRKPYDAFRETAKKYGISLEIYHELLALQRGLCAICGNRSSEALVVDHCHESGSVRGLLCRSCNTGIGLLGESIRNLTRALCYLQGSHEDTRMR
ncbi:endonuclease VII domain-containing protein [Catellatospora sichuanensis]|uniref:endonuclease VII domain-containing protein n=1 Tax=Catellatospora sichuanensis TaxID=1969805 RepID=UPI003CCC7FD8